MGRKKLSNEQKWQSHESDYNELKGKLGLIGDVIEDVQKLINTGVELQHEICGCADYIKGECLNDAKTATRIETRTNELTINKGTFQDFISKVVSSRKRKISEKSIEKTKNKTSEIGYQGKLRQAFAQSFLDNENGISSPTQFNENINISETTENNALFDAVNKGADMREHINKDLYGYYRQLVNAANYITKGELDWKKYKMLVDFEVYKGGASGVDHDYADRAEALARRCIDAITLTLKYGYDYFPGMLKAAGIDISVVNK